MRSSGALAVFLLGSAICLCFAACGDEVDDEATVAALQPGQLRTENIPLADPISRKRGSAWKYHYCLPEGSPERVGISFRVRLYEAGVETNSVPLESTAWQDVPSKGTIMCAHKSAGKGDVEFAVHISAQEGAWVSLWVPTADLLRHKVGDQVMTGGGAINTVAPERIELDKDIPTITQALLMTEEGIEGHPRKTLEETVKVNDKVISLVIRFTTE